MKSTISDEARELGLAVTEVLEGAGGVDLARRFEADPGSRQRIAEDLLDPIGLWEIEPREDQVQLEAAAEACRAAGGQLLMYPIAERLARPRDADALMLVPLHGRGVAAHADIDMSWAAATLNGNAATVTSRGPLVGEKLAAFVAEAEYTVTDARQENADLGIVLQTWWLLGVLERTLADTVVYTNERVQFGRPIVKFQGTQFALSSAAVAVQGLSALAKYTIWSIGRGDAAAGLVDAVALRVAGLEAAHTVMRTAHQLHGAMGFANETNVSQYSRHTQAVRRLPEGKTQTELIFAALLSQHGWESLFPVAPGVAARRSPATTHRPES